MQFFLLDVSGLLTMDLDLGPWPSIYRLHHHLIRSFLRFQKCAPRRNL